MNGLIVEAVDPVIIFITLWLVTDVNGGSGAWIEGAGMADSRYIQQFHTMSEVLQR